MSNTSAENIPDLPNQGSGRKRRHKGDAGGAAAESIRIPPGRVKKIIQRNEDIGKLAPIVPIIVAKATELFLGELLKSALQESLKDSSSNKVIPPHVKKAIINTEFFDFLTDLVKDVPDAVVVPTKKVSSVGAASSSSQPKTAPVKSILGKRKSSLIAISALVDPVNESNEQFASGTAGNAIKSVEVKLMKQEVLAKPSISSVISSSFNTASLSLSSPLVGDVSLPAAPRSTLPTAMPSTVFSHVTAGNLTQRISPSTEIPLSNREDESAPSSASGSLKSETASDVVTVPIVLGTVAPSHAPTVTTQDLDEDEYDD